MGLCERGGGGGAWVCVFRVCVRVCVCEGGARGGVSVFIITKPFTLLVCC